MDDGVVESRPGDAVLAGSGNGETHVVIRLLKLLEPSGDLVHFTGQRRDQSKVIAEADEEGSITSLDDVFEKVAEVAAMIFEEVFLAAGDAGDQAQGQCAGTALGEVRDDLGHAVFEEFDVVPGKVEYQLAVDADSWQVLKQQRQEVSAKHELS